MVLGELPALRKLLTVENKEPFTKKLGSHIELSKLEVIQLFHASRAKNRDSILTYGLIPNGKPAGEIIAYAPRIFVSTTYEETAFDYVSYNEVDVWTFYLPRRFLYADEFSGYANHYYIEVNVAWYKLTLLETR